MTNKVRAVRDFRGMSVSELARRAKTSRQTIYAIENGSTKKVDGKLMFRIADALDKDVREIFFDDGVSHEEQSA